MRLNFTTGSDFRNNYQIFVNKQVKAPWLKHFIYMGEEGLEYILPGQVLFAGN